jgi:hypothetical protein
MLLGTSNTCGVSWWLTRPGIRRSWQKEHQLLVSPLDLGSLEGLRSKAAREGRLHRRASSATPTLRQAWYQVTCFRFRSDWGRPSGCIIPRPYGSVPAARIVLFPFFSVRSAPRAASFPSRTGKSLGHVSFLTSTKSCLALLYLLVIACLFDAPGIPRGSRMLKAGWLLISRSCRHDACAWVRPCSAKKPKRLSSDPQPTLQA